MDYIERLREQLIKQGYGKRYIYLCEQYCTRLLQNGLPVIFDNIHFSLLLGMTTQDLGKMIFLTDSLYNSISIPKKSGGKREISIPTVNLKYVQRWILDNILYNIRVSSQATGFVKGLSIVDNARPHVNKECVITIDIENFFPTISFETIFRLFYYYGYTKEMSYVLAKLCTYEGKLPQGAPTSPYLSNIVSLKLDKRFNSLVNKLSDLNASYSRYADDLTVSGDKKIVKYVPLFKEIIQDERFIVNEKKFRVQNKPDRQMVTGIIVNEKISVPIQTKKYIRQQIYYCKKFGVDRHLEHIKSIRSNYKEYLYGIAYFIKMVENDYGTSLLEELNTIVWDY
ncbi:retron St85 family RNA-directed DNA polymerase [Clostridium formicaceticum]|uniref:RNA-directed DNA polymerase n=2 Tax=Clostridium formicaceticum TaxID=1497 RepID=A0AAC9WH35_9CLOT|nr:retron St85 family RNA-directed DNA polymerase [Clostridium formicaceticum]AOY77880.1 RNA-dependent DNA polymerase [Clostridium formicaceticum]ARE88498.1 Reverse transcriptase (RNA-dependent DNA polymerase) [Clostridium formicaceticum]